MHTPIDTQPTPTKRRRRYTPAQKGQIVEETMQPGASVSQVARRHDINANLLFKWRLAYRDGHLPKANEAALLPVQLTPSQQTREMARLELELGNGHRLTVYGEASERLLRTTLEVLTR